MKPLLKICGLKYPENIQEVADLEPDFMGFIFHPKSPRNVEGVLSPVDLREVKSHKVGVFVQKDLEELIAIADQYQLQFVQLHGSESPQYCEKVAKADINIIKVFSIAEPNDFDLVNDFIGLADFFLFDTKLPNAHGGHGVSFDWNMLKHYTGDTPFLLAGGISLENFDELQKIEHQSFAGIDVNSKFEIEPGLKNIPLLRQLKSQLITL